ncbi:MAG: hypothetical protein HPY66_0276 [Firmicutes bacterium]|nr:hypothetical protein [Bacillota bacterium]MDI6704698.1 FapA family protein [Bacillota bacterium]
MRFEGKSYDEALKKGLNHFGISREEASVRLIKEGKNVLGMSIETYVVEVTPQKAPEESINGSFRILYREDGVYIDVRVPVGLGARPSMEEVKTRLEYKKVMDVKMDAVFEALASESDTIVRIAPPQQEMLYDAALKVEISPDAKKAFLTLIPPDGGKNLTEKDIIEGLKEEGVVAGIDHDTIRRMVTENNYGQPTLVASALLPVDGENGYIEYGIKHVKNKKPVEREDGSVDFRELDLIENVKAGQVLARIVPPTKGVDGSDVRGNPLKAKDGVAVRIQKGKNTEFTQNGTVLVSLIDGQVSESGGKINVYPVYEVIGNVDNSTGNIRFVGKVIVKGNVLTGFTIEADGDIEVNGVVEGATLRAGGNIILKRGAQGGGKGILRCAGNLYSKFIENCNVEAEGDVFAEAIMHSSVISKSSVETKGKKGIIVGGTIAARAEVNAKIIGSPMATITHIEVGSDPDLRKNVDAITKSIEDDRKALEQLSLSIGTIAKLAQSGRIPAEKKITLNKCIEAKSQIEERLQEKEAQLAVMKAQLEVVSKGKVRAKEVMYPGTIVTIGPSSMHIKDYINFVTLYRSEGEIKIGPYDF